MGAIFPRVSDTGLGWILTERKKLAMASELSRFIYRAKVLDLYRDLLRTAGARTVSKDTRKALVEQIKTEFTANRNVNDLRRIQFLVADGKRRRDQLVEMLGLAYSNT
uniref:Complex 1 LYR protein domain-containing protein n=1 Tax=Rhodosorus marinus TaxID=101924 RepID=A0A7S0BDA0_9RHOD|mmetsp:Transcript_11267/g.16297  ORF Transcript_11267/g.16297 Transcript_11267/m.16297 type:complete len:108 (+) Transcript_11267:949-1272(+)